MNTPDPRTLAEIADVALTCRRMALAANTHLTRADALFVARMIQRETVRFYVLLDAYAGQRVTSRECAGLILRIAKRVDAGGAA